MQEVENGRDWCCTKRHPEWLVKVAEDVENGIDSEHGKAFRGHRWTHQREFSHHQRTSPRRPGRTTQSEPEGSKYLSVNTLGEVMEIVKTAS